MKRLALFCALGFFAIAGVGAQDLLLMGFHEGNSPPYAFIVGGELKAGVMKDLGDELIRSLKIPGQYVFSSRNRLALDMSTGRINARLITNPDWVPERDLYRWSLPYLTDHDVIATLPGHKPIASLADAKGLVLGTLLGFIYSPELEAGFASGAIIRDDAKTLEANYKRLQMGHIDALVDSDLLIDYLTRDEPRKLQVHPYIVSENHLAVAVSPRFPADISAVNDVLNRLIANGSLERILQKYGIAATGQSWYKKP